MQASKTKSKKSQPESNSIAWDTFLKASCDALFQTALLISADCAVAEAGLLAAFEEIDVAEVQAHKLASLQYKVVTLTLLKLEKSHSPKMREPRSLLQNGLWPVLELERTARAGFVLRYLLGYSIAVCSHLLKLDEADVKPLLSAAVLQLQSAVESIEDARPHMEHECCPAHFQSGSHTKTK